MKNIRKILLLLLVIIQLNACNSKEKNHKDHLTYQCPMQCEGEKTFDTPGTCAVCNMNLEPVAPNPNKEVEISDMSVYNLPSVWTNQDNQEIKLMDLKGDILVMVMVYTSCQVACPRLVADMRAIEKGLPETIKNQVKFLFVSIDPETDTPKRLKEFAIENEMDNDQWVFLRGSIEDTREFAAVLAVRYKKISPIDFSHSNIISVFDQHGELVYQKEGLGVDYEKTVAKVMELSN